MDGAAKLSYKVGRNNSHPQTDYLHARTHEDMVGFTSTPHEPISSHDSSMSAADDAAMEIIDSFVGPMAVSSGELIWAIKTLPEYLRRRLCPDLYERLFSALVTGEDILFSISVLFAIVMKFPDQAEEIADMLMAMLLPLLQSDQQEIYEGVARLASHLIGYTNNIGIAIMECMPVLIAFNGDVLMNGDYDEKVATWHFFRSLSAMTGEEFIDLLPADIRSELLESLLDRDDAEHIQELIEREDGGE
jgi:hypothetical protein